MLGGGLSMYLVKEPETIETNAQAPFPFTYVEKQLRKKNFGILTTVTPQGRPHSVGVVYAVAPPDMPFSLYLISRPVLKKARNIRNNSNVSFVVPFPHYLLRLIPPSCVQFQGKAELIPFDDPIAIKAFQSSIVLRRSLLHSAELGESIFFRIVPDKKIFCYGIGANVWQFLIPSQNKKVKNFYVVVPQNRRSTENCTKVERIVEPSEHECKHHLAHHLGLSNVISQLKLQLIMKPLKKK